MVNGHTVPIKLRFVGGICFAAMANPLLATNYYVKTNGSDSADGLSWTTAFATVGKAIATAAHNDVVDVNEGTYTECINYSGKRIHVRSTDPNDPDVVAATVINGNSTSLDTVTFRSGETAGAILDGFTVRSGKYGVYCTSSSSPTVKHCVIRNNSSIGVYVYGGSPAIIDCEIRQNGNKGLCLLSSSSAVAGCRVLSNNGNGISGEYYSGTIKNCVIARNSSWGIRLTSSSSASVINCTLASNTAYGVYGACSQIKNCILWSNGNDLNGCSATYSCIEDRDSGTGVIHELPLFVDAANDDYHLWYVSPCIDTGDPSSSYANEPNGGGGRIDMGAYGNTAEATTIVDTDADGLDDRWETTYWPGQDLNLHDANDDPDGDSLRNKDEYYLHWDPNSNDLASIIGLVHNGRVDVNYPSISLALSMAADNDTLTLAAGTFIERINFNGRPVHLRSTDPNDPGVVAATVINGNSTSLDTVTFSSGETASAILEGITIRGGRKGVSCSSSSPTIRKCVLCNNSQDGVLAYYSSPTISDCEIRQNGSYGLYLDHGSSAVTRCRILSNGSPYSYGIRADYYSGSIKNCVIARNAGRGMNLANSSSASVLNCTVAFNTSHGISGFCAQVENCILWGNGDDLYSCFATYSCIEDQDAGLGMIHILPMFVDADNDDYHLRDWSRCIDSGNPSSDYSLEPNGGGGRINMGAYGNTSEAETLRDSNGDGVPEGWLEYFWPGYDPNDPDYSAAGNPDLDDFNNLTEYLFGYAPNQPNSDNMTIIASLSTTRFDPTNSESVKVTYLINRAADVATSFTNTSTAEAFAVTNEPVSAGIHEVTWDGKDTGSLIVERGFYDAIIDANDGNGHTALNDQASTELYYVHDIAQLCINPLRIIATHNEITKITYDLNIDANMVIEVFDPCGVPFATPLDGVAQTQGPCQFVWDGRTKDPGDPESCYPLQEGEYTVRVRFAGMREEEEQTVFVFK